MLDAGPAAAGYADQCWTLARIAEQVWQRFGVEYTLAGMDVLLHRLGWSVQVPARRAAERDEEQDRQVAGGDLAGGKRTAADLGAWLVFEDESGQGLRPPKGRTWGRRGHTPVVKVTGGHNTRVSLAALIATRPGHRTRLIYRTAPAAGTAMTSAKASPRPTTPGSWTPRTSNSAARSWWCGTA